LTGTPRVERATLTFAFPGRGAQYPEMTRGLYEAETAFREEVDLCTELLRPHVGADLREMLYPDPVRKERAAQRLADTSLAQMASFVVEYALAKLWMRWGVRPEGLIGQDVGEYVAACLAGVFSLEDALRLLVARGRLTGQSPMMESSGAAFAERCRQVALREPRIPYLSNVTGTWVTAADALDADYWVRHLREASRFADGLRRLLAEPGRVLLEIGPGDDLCRAAESERGAEKVPTYASLGAGNESALAAEGQIAQLLETQGRLWMAGIPVDWHSFYSSERRRRLALPTYPFERQRCWVEPSYVAPPPTSSRTASSS